MLSQASYAVTYISSCQALSTPGETYVLNSSISSPASGCFTIEADGITLDCSGHYIRGTIPHPSSFVAIYAAGRQNLRIENCDVSYFNAGIMLNGSSYSDIVNNSLTGNQNGIYLLSSDWNTLDGNMFWGNRKSAIMLNNSDNNLILNMPLSGDNGVYLTDSAAFNTIQNNTLHGSSGVDIENGANNNIVTGNNISNNAWSVVIIDANYNKITDNIISSSSYDGVLIIANHTTVEGNNISNNPRGVYLQEEANYNEIKDNAISNNEYGIYFTSGPDYNLVTGNIISYNSNAGIYLYSSQYNTIYNNFFDNPVNVIASYYTSPNYWNTSKTLAFQNLEWDFDSNASGWTPWYGDWSVHDGVYECQGTYAGGHGGWGASTAGDSQWQDYTVEARVKSLGPNWAY
ncbi:MAG: right-handed parallel beta-helix repeat-containing protein, partial [Candidatus Micrarchaeota archaeon]|nr:right-handed parallel beta-helix repeat-containing protein [Candidatus Micrarchaeota archaeon]